MSKSIRRMLERLFEWLISASVILGGLSLMGGCAYIYFGVGTYTSETVASVFKWIAPPVWIAVGMIAVSVVWKLVCPPLPEFFKSPKDYTAILSRLHAMREKDAAAERQLVAEQKCRRCWTVVRLAVIGIGLAVFFSYAVNPAHYVADINASMIRAMQVAIPCFTVPFAVSVSAAYAIDKSYQREIAFLKTLPAHNGKTTDEPCDTKDRFAFLRKIASIAVPAILLAAAVAAIVYGAVTGGTESVIAKAVKICTECIGLG